MDRAVLIITAVVAEMAPLRRKLGLKRTDSFAPPMPSWASRELPLFGLVSGVAAPNAEALIDAAIESTGAEAVIIAGLGGALVSTPRTGEIMVPIDVVDESTGQVLHPRYDLDVVPAGRLVTAAEPVPTPSAKAELGQRFEASVVDMETAPLAAACDARRVPWAAVRAIGDELRDTMPPQFAGILRHDGRADPVAALRLLAQRPDLVPTLIRTARCAQLGGRSLAVFLRGVLGPED